MVGNLLSKAGDAGSIPDWGTQIPRAKGRLNARPTTTEPARCD